MEIKPLVILDLDGTLILRMVKLHPRKGLYYFLDQLLTEYQVAIYTAITKKNVDYIMKILFSRYISKFLFIWDREYTIPDIESSQGWAVLKDLNKVKKEFQVGKVLIIDDDLLKVRKNPITEVLICQKFVSVDENYNLKDLLPLIKNKFQYL